MPVRILKIFLLISLLILPAKPSFANGAGLIKVKKRLERILGRDLYILVVDKGEPDAYLHPMGYIVITKGMIDCFADESDLAFIIAHETGHMERRHYRGEDGLLGLSQETRDLTKEIEADSYAVSYLKAMGYEPSASIRVLERLIKLGQGDVRQLEKRIQALRASFPFLRGSP